MRRQQSALPLILTAVIILTISGGLWYLNRLSQDSENGNQRILIIGNSFTYQNNLDQMVGEFIEAIYDGRISVETTFVAFGGYRLFDHLDDLEENYEESQLREFLLDGSVRVRDWNLVIFQEQVEIPGLPSYQESQSSSIFAATTLSNFAHINGSKVMLLETWGNGFSPDDPENPYPEFPTMQNQISIEIVTLTDAIVESGTPAEISPAGEAFLTVYNDVLASGGDPYAEESPFLALYAEDQEHASFAGSYLAAAVISASYTNRPVSDISWDQPNVDDDFELYLRQIADRVVFGSE